MSERRCHTDGLLCAWEPWSAHPDIRNLLTRRCKRCRAVDIRCLPPDVPAGRAALEVLKKVGVSDTPTFYDDRREER